MGNPFTRFAGAPPKGGAEKKIRQSPHERGRRLVENHEKIHSAAVPSAVADGTAAECMRRGGTKKERP